MKRFTRISATLIALSLSFSAYAFDYQSVINKGVQGAVTGAIEGKSGKEILKDTKTTTGQEAQQQVQQHHEVPFENSMKLVSMNDAFLLQSFFFLSKHDEKENITLQAIISLRKR